LGNRTEFVPADDQDQQAELKVEDKDADDETDESHAAHRHSVGDGVPAAGD
jgi:hypothetical protein